MIRFVSTLNKPNFDAKIQLFTDKQACHRYK